MPRYKKKPVEIDAVYFSGEKSCDEVTDFLGGPYATNHRWKSSTPEGGFIITLEGEMEFNKTDYIIKGIKGEFYPCKKDIFESSYELVS